MESRHEAPASGAGLDEFLRALSAEDLQSFKLDTEEDLGEIKGQLAEARRMTEASGVIADGVWLSRAEAAARIKARQLNATCAEQGRRNRERRDAIAKGLGSDPLASAFIAVARETLDPAQYQVIMHRAHEVARERLSALMESRGLLVAGATAGP